jgi:cobalt-zinc-cadmium efflux system protein
VNVLLEGTPEHVDVGALRVALLGIPGVLEVYDLHVWTVTSGVDAMSAHVVASPTASRDEVLAAVRARVASDFGITHTTIQVEGPDAPRGTNHD